MSKISQLTPLTEEQIDGSELAPVTKGSGTFSAPIAYLGRRAALLAEAARDVAVAAGVQYTSEAAAVSGLADGAFGSYLDAAGRPVWAQRVGAGMVPLPGPWIGSDKISYGIGGTVQDALDGRATSEQLSQIGGQIVGVMRQARGAIVRNLDDKISDTLSIKDHGAIGDGTLHTIAEWIVPGALGRYASLAALQVDYPHATSTSQSIDEVAVQSAVEEAKLNTSGGWVEIHGPLGDYLIDKVTIDGERIRFTGPARYIKTTHTGTMFLFDGGTGRLFGGGMDGPTLGAAVTGISGELLRAVNFSQISVNVKIKPFPAKAYRGLVFEKCYRVLLKEDWEIVGCVQDGVYMDDSLDIYFDPGNADANGRYGIHFNNCSGFYLDSVTCFGNGAEGYNFDSIGTPVEADINGFGFLFKCIGDSNGGHNMRFKQVGYTVVFGCWGASQLTLNPDGTFGPNTTSDKHGFALDSCYQMGFYGCIGIGNNGGGLVDAGVFASESITVMGCILNNNGQIAVSGVRAGIWLRDSGKFKLIGNTTTDTQPVKTQQHGINVRATMASLLMIGNDMIGNAAGPYQFEAIPTNFVQSANMTGESGVYASATNMTVSPFLDSIRITGSEDIYDITPRIPGRTLVCRMAGAARFIDQAFGSAFALPSSNITPAANGTAMFTFDSTADRYLHLTHSINDGA